MKGKSISKKVKKHCEWLYDSKYEWAKSECGFLDTHRIKFTSFKYCPYCRKEIKITTV